MKQATKHQTLTADNDSRWRIVVASVELGLMLKLRLRSIHQQSMWAERHNFPLIAQLHLGKSRSRCAHTPLDFLNPVRRSLLCSAYLTFLPAPLHSKAGFQGGEDRAPDLPTTPADFFISRRYVHAWFLISYRPTERRLIQHWIDCMQFFFYIIFAVLLKCHDFNNRHYHCR